MSEVYDVLIIGAGPAGLTAGIYLARSCLKIIILEKISPGGMALIIDNLENYPGFPEGIAGYDLASKMEAQARKFGTNIIPEEVLNISGCGGDFSVKGSEKIYKARSVLVSTGSRYEKLRIPGEEELTGKGVSYCATCDGAFFRNRKVAVVGGGNSALQEALYLSRIASEVFLIHRRDAYRGSKLLQKRISENTKIKPVLDSIVTEIRGKDTVESIVVKNVKTEKESKIGVEGVFVAVGQKPNTAFCKNLLKMDEKGHIITAERSLQTSVEGVFVAGDCRVSDLRQVATAVGDGALVSESIDKYLQGKQ
ncbi:MAG: thioredoxin-disulfide reductase [Candidatus Firestonebacteria bacterium RIFOXYC2_FULL_39_67]|nr:MAG: thioredoxin-disulfide reductase [Candidatus Firestonebacteria bacterium RIFOXYD2_FULL_39_29]OGF53789.1 MAG: thioredoxin-disulfide reductase [Candidatus Firestonebacteria bacterium RIFOXYC2_FULL_39_67]OGF54674.1 MAG: thioredoxin-disulfide reductase [Candidatus Firestonebacteria bacterium RifOxyC12_full_39_7]